MIVLLGAGCGLGGAALWHGKPENWSDVIAQDDTVRKIARGLVGMSTLLLVSGVATLQQVA